MINFWRHRPVIKDKQIAATTARNEIIQLDMVLKWIDRQGTFSWELPRHFSDIERKRNTSFRRSKPSAWMT